MDGMSITPFSELWEHARTESEHEKAQDIAKARYRKAIDAINFAFSGIQHFKNEEKDSEQRIYMTKHLAKVLLELGEL
jgi:hypothetical protein